jgi:nitrate reductase NapE component
MENLSPYPRNLGGLALLLLRTSLGLLLLANAQSAALLAKPGVITFLISGLCIGLFVGIFTPLLSSIAFLGGIGYLVWMPACPCMVRIVTLALCVSTAILGSGAYSMDGVLFGRRRVIL